MVRYKHKAGIIIDMHQSQTQKQRTVESVLASVRAEGFEVTSEGYDRLQRYAAGVLSADDMLKESSESLSCASHELSKN